MTEDRGTEIGDDELEAALRIVRKLDPSHDAETVRQFLQEIADAASVVESIQTDHAVPLPVAFVPTWEPGVRE